MQIEIHSCFKPIAEKNAKILILGSLPGPQSLQSGQYYKHKSNCFWKIMFTIYNKSFTEDYAQRKKLLTDNNVAVWDVLACASRKGALDSAIKNETLNDFTQFFLEHKSIMGIIFNGAKAKTAFEKHCAPVLSQYKWVQCPSTSAAHAKPFAEKLNSWQAAIQYIINEKFE